jgi:hypothetical protein
MVGCIIFDNVCARPLLDTMIRLKYYSTVHSSCVSSSSLLCRVQARARLVSVIRLCFTCFVLSSQLHYHVYCISLFRNVSIPPPNSPARLELRLLLWKSRSRTFGTCCLVIICSRSAKVSLHSIVYRLMHPVRVASKGNTPCLSHVHTPNCLAQQTSSSSIVYHCRSIVSIVSPCCDLRDLSTSPR